MNLMKAMKAMDGAKRGASQRRTQHSTATNIPFLGFVFGFWGHVAEQRMRTKIPHPTLSKF